MKGPIKGHPLPLYVSDTRPRLPHEGPGDMDSKSEAGISMDKAGFIHVPGPCNAYTPPCRLGPAAKGPPLMDSKSDIQSPSVVACHLSRVPGPLPSPVDKEPVWPETIRVKSGRGPGRRPQRHRAAFISISPRATAVTSATSGEK